MNSFALFTDASVSPQRKLGIGGYLLVPLPFLERGPNDIEPGEVASMIELKRFDDTSSTKLEVQTVVWALEHSRPELTRSAAGSLRIYTDSQCVAGLLRRRAALEISDFIAKRSGRPLANAALYRDFYAAYDHAEFQVFKVAGHSVAGSHDVVQRIFSYVDREVRKALKPLAGLP